MRKQIGSYRLEGVIGRGGGSTVYRAFPESGEEPVALKVLSEDWAAEEKGIQRFLREGRSAQALDHPNIVRCLDVGSHEGRLYIAMELVEGGTLGERLQAEERIPEREALEITLEVARALEYAHAAGFFHRDVKPANILIGRDGTVLLADLGLTRPLSEEDLITTPGEAVGTPHYISPEQIQVGRVDERCDLYSLGCTLYHMLTGVPPYHKAPSIARILDGHLGEDPEPIINFSPEVRARTLRLVQSMMQKKPRQRVPSAPALCRRIEEALYGPRSRIVGCSVPVRLFFHGSLLWRVGIVIGMVAVGAWAVFLGWNKSEGRAGKSSRVHEVEGMGAIDNRVQAEVDFREQKPLLHRAKKREDAILSVPREERLTETTALDMIRQEMKGYLKREDFGRLDGLIRRIDQEEWNLEDRDTIGKWISEARRKKVRIQREIFSALETARHKGDVQVVRDHCERVMNQGDAMASFRARQILAEVENRVIEVRVPEVPR